jgi:uncharacterized protein (TIGR02246 family)
VVFKQQGGGEMIPVHSTLSDKDRNTIKALSPRLEQVALASDWDSFLELFVDDLVVMPPNVPVIKGRSAYRKFIDDAGFVITKMDFDITDVEGSSEIVCIVGTYRETYTLPYKEQPIYDQGKILAVLRKQSDGSWLITHWMWNTDLPLPG